MTARSVCAPVLSRTSRIVRSWALAGLALLGPAWAQDTTAPLGTGDEVQITVFGEPDFSGKYTVDAAGALALPWAGRVKAEGKSLAQIEQDLIERLKAGYLGDPKVNVSIVERRPFYVMGDVKTPGKYSFADGMTMLQAVASAGGFRTPETADVRLAQDFVRAQENADVLLVDLRSALALSARLTAERDGSMGITMPQELLDLGAPEARAAVEGETRLFQSRRQALDGEIALLEKQKAGFLEEITALNGQIVAKDQQGKLLQEELADVTSLFNRGIERKPQLFLLQRTVAEAESDRLQIVSYLARAKQNVASTELSMVNKRNDRAAEVLRQLQDTGDRLQRLRTQRAAALQILDKTNALLTGQGASAGDNTNRHILLVSRRAPEGTKTSIVADDETVMPGDLVNVLPARKPQDPAIGGPISSTDTPPLALR